MTVHPPSFNDAAPARTDRTQPIPAKAGIGLRLPHHRLFKDSRPDVVWIEAHPENYMTPGAADELAAVAERYPVSLHAVGLSLGSARGLDEAHLARLQALERRIRPGLMSDHLSWSTAYGPAGPLGLPDLLPLPYTEEALGVVIRNVDRAQDVLDRAMLIENPSSYVQFADSRLGEAEFLAAVARATGCGVLLDVNNIYVSAMNHGADLAAALDLYLDHIPAEAIGEIHLAGHAERDLPGGRCLRIDDHGSPVRPEVWALFETVIARIGARPTLIEWDTDIPPLEVLQGEAAAAQSGLDRAAAAIHV